MEGYLRIGLLVIAGIVLALTAYEAWNARRRLKLAEIAEEKRQEPKVSLSETPVSSPQKNTAQNDDYQNLIVLSVVAKPDCQFASYELLQAITATGMRFGEMNIFHYYVDRDNFPNCKSVEAEENAQHDFALFSLASATKPGEFDLDRIGEFACTGLTLFMDISKVPYREQAFELMLHTAEQLADDLDGELRAGQRYPWNKETEQYYFEKVSQYNGCTTQSYATS